MKTHLRRSYTLLLLLVLLLVGGGLYLWWRPAMREASAGSVGMSAERLERIDRVMQRYVDQQRIPGAVALVVRRGQIVYHKAFGFNDLEKRRPLRRDAIMRIASMSKAITSVAVMMLYEEGYFLLDDPVSTYLPAFKNPRVLASFNPADSTFTTQPARREITIHDLLTHTSGISYPEVGTLEATAIYAKYDIPSGIGTPFYKLPDAMNKLATLPLVHQPGERYVYGLNTDLLGYLVEVVSGQPLDVFLRQRLFDPLGMDDTWFYLPPAQAARLSTLFAEFDLDSTVVASPGGGFYPNFPIEKGTYLSGGAGLVSTAYDYALFVQMLLNGGELDGHRLLSPATVRLMLTDQLGEKNQGTRKMSLGFLLAGEKEASRLPVSVGSIDWNGIYGTTYWADPKEELVGVLLTQKYPNSYVDLGEKFKVLVYQALTELNP
jgi:CubicO group peptidase (beta-lactamase class C family)